MPSELSFSRLYYTYFAIDGDKNFLNDSEYNEKHSHPIGKEKVER